MQSIKTESGPVCCQVPVPDLLIFVTGNTNSADRQKLKQIPVTATIAEKLLQKSANTA